MQSLDSQLQSLRNQIEGMNGHGTIAPSQAYNKLPHFLPSGGGAPRVPNVPSGGATTLGSVYGSSAIQELKPYQPATIPEEHKKKSYLWIAILILVLLMVAAGVALYFLRRQAKKKQEMEEKQMKALAADIDDRMQKEEQRWQEEERREAEVAAQRDRDAARKLEAEQFMKQQVTASLLAQKQVSIPVSPKVSPASPKVPVAATPPPIPVKTESVADEPLKKGQEYLDKAIANVSETIRSGLEQAILAQKTFVSAEPQRDESLLHNQGELGLQVSGVAKFDVHSDVLDAAVEVHPTGETPVAGTPPPVSATAELAEI